jgi:hypothetical protein
MSHSVYKGTELSLFRRAENWKPYWAKLISAHIAGDVLEVGAGIGANTELLAGSNFVRWVCVEPDATLLTRSLEGSSRFRITCLSWTRCWMWTRPGGLMQFSILTCSSTSPTIRAEMSCAAARLKPGGRLIVVSPAHQWLFTAFDRCIGHYRRYTKD